MKSNLIRSALALLFIICVIFASSCGEPETDVSGVPGSSLNSSAEYQKKTSSEVTNKKELISAIESGVDVIVINGSVELDEPLLIKRNLTISGGEICRSGKYTGNLIVISGTKTEVVLLDITVDGKCYDSSTDKFTRNAQTMIVLSGTSMLTLDGASIVNNKSDNGAAIACGAGTSLYITGDTLISRNYATGSGGAIMMSTKSSMNMDGGTLSYNTADGYGGCIHAENSEINLMGGIAENNSTSHNGGFLVLRSASVCTFNGIAVRYTYGKDSGGTIRSYDSTLIFKDGDFSDNESRGTGGIVHATGSVVTISGGNFTGNKSTGHGGVIYAENSNITIESGTFDKNKADKGSVIYYNGNTGKISKEDFTEVITISSDQ